MFQSRFRFMPQGASSTKSLGDQAEDLALAHLRAAGLELIQRHYRPAGRVRAEIDLIMRDPDGTVVFVEVRARSTEGHGGALASVDRGKRQRIVWAARCFLQKMAVEPACRFDVVGVAPGPDGQGRLQWIRGAFDADG
jgi:putative endonuclease